MLRAMAWYNPIYEFPRQVPIQIEGFREYNVALRGPAPGQSVDAMKRRRTYKRQPPTPLKHTICVRREQTSA